MAKSTKKKTSKKSTANRSLSDKHPGHSQHMCELVRKREMSKVGKLSRDAKFICHICGRAAAKPTNLCEPVEI